MDSVACQEAYKGVRPQDRQALCAAMMSNTNALSKLEAALAQMVPAMAARRQGIVNQMAALGSGPPGVSPGSAGAFPGSAGSSLQQPGPSPGSAGPSPGSAGQSSQPPRPSPGSAGQFSQPPEVSPGSAMSAQDAAKMAALEAQLRAHDATVKQLKAQIAQWRKVPGVVENVNRRISAMTEGLRGGQTQKSPATTGLVSPEEQLMDTDADSDEGSAQGDVSEASGSMRDPTGESAGVQQMDVDEGSEGAQMEEIKESSQSTQGEEKKEGASDEDLRSAYQTLKEYQTQGRVNPLTQAQSKAAELLETQYLIELNSNAFQALVDMREGKVPSEFDLPILLNQLATLVPQMEEIKESTGVEPMDADEDSKGATGETTGQAAGVATMTDQQWGKVVNVYLMVDELAKVEKSDANVKKQKRQQLEREWLDYMKNRKIGSTFWKKRINESSTTYKRLGAILDAYKHWFFPSRLQIFRKMMEILNGFIRGTTTVKQLRQVIFVLDKNIQLKTIGWAASWNQIESKDDTEEYENVLKQMKDELKKKQPNEAQLKELVQTLIDLIELRRPKTTLAQVQWPMKPMKNKPIKGVLKRPPRMTDEEYQRALQMRTPPTSPTERDPSKLKFQESVGVAEYTLSEPEQQFKLTEKYGGIPQEEMFKEGDPVERLEGKGTSVGMIEPIRKSTATLTDDTKRTAPYGGIFTRKSDLDKW